MPSSWVNLYAAIRRDALPRKQRHTVTRIWHCGSRDAGDQEACYRPERSNRDLPDRRFTECVA